MNQPISAASSHYFFRNDIPQKLEKVLGAVKEIKSAPDRIEKIKSVKQSLDEIKLSSIYLFVLKICNFVIKIFNSNFKRIDELFKSDELCASLLKRVVAIIDCKNIDPLKDFVIEGDDPLINSVRLGLCELEKLRLEHSASKLDEFIQQNRQLPPELEKIVKEATVLCGLNPEISDHLTQTAKVLKTDLFEVNAALYRDLIGFQNELDETHINHRVLNVKNKIVDTIRQITENAPLMKNLMELNLLERSETDAVFDTSFARQEKFLARELNEGVNVTMVSVEYAGLIKEGGLAEAVEGLSQAIRKQNDKNKVQLVFPNFSLLPKDVKKNLEKIEIESAPCDVYKAIINGVECYFLDDPSFVIEGEKPTIYDEKAQERFATFTVLAAKFIHDCLKTDVIHLHDWHVAGVASYLKNNHSKEWEEGETTPVVFTFHNNNRVAQGRVNIGPYNYDNYSEGFAKRGIIQPGGNLFIETLKIAHAVTTVSETFAKESQQVQLGEGASFAVREAAKSGKVTGIINGVNTTSWNPKTDISLQKWIDPINKNPVDLTYGPDDKDIVDKKQMAKVQLVNWLKKYAPKIELDSSKPLVTYIGRYDTYQKGIDKLEEAIEATLKNGGQFICMGTGEDEEATTLLTTLEHKYRGKQGVFFIRDFRKDGKLFYQQGTKEMPGIGSLVRAASDFLFIPSRFEPCGLVQFEGWLFGSLAIGSNTGGLTDTIISKGENYNGYIFEREGASETGAAAVIGKALSDWKRLDVSQKTELTRKIMRDGKRYGWNDSPHGIAPVDKYLHIYRVAKLKARIRTLAGVELIDALRSQLFKVRGASDEEKYLKAVNLESATSTALEPLYLNFHPGMRQQLPLPYGKGVDRLKYQTYGAFCKDSSTTFKVYAPNANKVSLVLFDENGRRVKKCKMGKVGDSFELDAIGITSGQRYCYEIDGTFKIDPYGRSHKMPDSKSNQTFSIVTKSEHIWSDEEWIAKRKDSGGHSQPMSVYEIHPTTWKQKNGYPLNYQELGVKLIAHCKKTGYTHVELMGILEHPCEASWGYQPVGFFAPNRRLGTPEDFKAMVNLLHENGIGVILDWVPAHFATDSFGLQQFDGTPLFEPKRTLAYFLSVRNWFFNYGATHFNFKSLQVREFLISSAHFWINEMHIDGLRLDCVRSLLNTEDPQSAELFMRDLNAVVKKEGAITIAEDYSGDPRVTKPSYEGGLDFDLKWDTSFEYYEKNYFNKPLAERKYDDLKRGILQYGRRQMMVFSHDRLKKISLKDWSPLPEGQKEDNLKAMIALMMCCPGKKLQFMGTETGTSEGWEKLVGKRRGLLDNVNHTLEIVGWLNQIYKSYKALYEKDYEESNLEWIEDPNQKIHAFRRIGSDGNNIICLFNLASNKQESIVLKMNNRRTRVILGLPRIEDSKVTVPPLSTVMIEEGF